MPLVVTEHDPASRKRVTRVYFENGAIGAACLVVFTLLRLQEPQTILARHGAHAPFLVLVFLTFATLLATFRFPLTEKIFVSLVIIANIAMFPLLGPVLSSWIAVGATVAQRLLAARKAKNQGADRAQERARTLALFATYGVPVIVAGLLFERLGGAYADLQRPSFASGLRIAVCGVAMIVTNNLIVARVEHAYGYSAATSLKLGVIDSSIYLVTLPYAVLTTFCYVTMGIGGLSIAAFTGIIANAVGHKLAVTRSDREQLIQRLASLTNIGRSISLRSTTDELLRDVYDECRKVIDVSLFSIALLDKSTNELRFELSIEAGGEVPKWRMPLGGGLNSWVVRSGQPLLVGSAREERKLGLVSYDDGLPTESWLGVPMMAREEAIGVISVQSYQENAFTQDDVVLLSAIASQAAVAIENAHLYKDLEGLNLALEHRVFERTNELRETNLRLLAADRSKNQFLANMSHELRTPLNAIIGFSSVLQDSAREMLPIRLYRFVDNIRTAGGHLLELINDILDLAKIEAGKLQLHTDSFDLHGTVSTVERVMKGIAAETNISIVSKVESDIGPVYLDEGRLKQILLNLLSNAVKFSPAGGFVYLNVFRAPADAWIVGTPSIRIEVIDSGIGIEEQELTRIFEEFYQVNDPRRVHKGTGLGLSLTKAFVELQHGRIAVESRVGAGTRFTIDLPRDLRQLGLGAERMPIRARAAQP